MPVEAPVTMANCAATRFVSKRSSRSRSSWLHHHLDAFVLLVAERLVEFRSLFEGGAVRDHEGRIDLAFLDALEQLRQVVLHGSLGHAEGKTAIDGRSHRDVVEEAAVDADDRDGAEVAAAMNRLAQH